MPIKYRVTSKAKYNGDQFCTCGSRCIRYQSTINGNFIGWCCCKCEPKLVARAYEELKDHWMKPIKHLDA